MLRKLLEELPLEIRKVSKKEVYLYLTKEYGFTPDDIACMNPYVQLAYYNGSDIVSFNTQAELDAYMRSRNK